LQNWGNYADIGQALAIYTAFTIDVLLVCWFGTQLTQHVRHNYLFYSKYVTYIMRSSPREFGNQTWFEQSVVFSTIWPSELSSFVRILGKVKLFLVRNRIHNFKHFKTSSTQTYQSRIMFCILQTCYSYKNHYDNMKALTRNMHHVYIFYITNCAKRKWFFLMKIKISEF